MASLTKLERLARRVVSYLFKHAPRGSNISVLIVTPDNKLLHAANACPHCEAQKLREVADKIDAKLRGQAECN